MCKLINNSKSQPKTQYQQLLYWRNISIKKKYNWIMQIGVFGKKHMKIYSDQPRHQKKQFTSFI